MHAWGLFHCSCCTFFGTACTLFGVWGWGLDRLIPHRVGCMGLCGSWHLAAIWPHGTPRGPPHVNPMLPWVGGGRYCGDGGGGPQKLKSWGGTQISAPPTCMGSWSTPRPPPCTPKPHLTHPQTPMPAPKTHPHLPHTPTHHAQAAQAKGEPPTCTPR